MHEKSVGLEAIRPMREMVSDLVRIWVVADDLASSFDGLQIERPWPATLCRTRVRAAGFPSMAHGFPMV